MTKVTFEIYVVTGDDLKELSEESIRLNLENYRDLLVRQGVLQGALLIEVPGQATVRVMDELAASVQGLCFAPAVALLEEERECYVYRYMSTDAHLVMLRLADLVRLIGEYTPAVTEEMQSLLPALFDCGVRFLEFLGRLGDRANATAQYLQPSADRARNVLQLHAML